MSVTFHVPQGTGLPYLNVSETNFVSLMKLVDWPYSSVHGNVGEVAVSDLQRFRDQVQFALAGFEAMPELDAGREGSVTKKPGGATAIDCGRAEGYFRLRLQVLLQLTDAALERQCPLQFD